MICGFFELTSVLLAHLTFFLLDLTSYQVMIDNPGRWDMVKLVTQPSQPKRINYYGKFRKARLKYFLHNLNVRLLKWIRNKYKRFRNRIKAAKRWLRNVCKINPYLFAHWSFGVRP